MICPTCKCVFCDDRISTPDMDPRYRKRFCSKLCKTLAWIDRARAEGRISGPDCRKGMKIAYATADAARDALLRSNLNGMRLADVYECDGHWHTTSQSARSGATGTPREGDS